jgi:hypothetical protein
MLPTGKLGNSRRFGIIVSIFNRSEPPGVTIDPDSVLPKNPRALMLGNPPEVESLEWALNDDGSLDLFTE